MRMPGSILLVSILLPLHAFGAREVVSYFQTDHRYNYRTELLELALGYANARQDAPYFDLEKVEDLPHPRGTRQIKSGTLRGVMSLATNHQREKDYLPVKIPTMAGILGMRVFLTLDYHQPLFNQVSSLRELQLIPLGFVQHWGDISVLRHNGMNVIPAARYDTVLPMMVSQRFSYFPRGINEVTPEFNKFKSSFPQLAIEKNIALFYPYPVYFFVNKEDKRLAEAIEYGLKKALSNDRFKQLFLHHHQDILNQLNFEQRKIYVLDNPTLPLDTPIPDMSWWLKNKLLKEE